MPPNALTVGLLVSGLALTVGGLVIYKPGLQLLGSLAGGAGGVVLASGWGFSPVAMLATVVVTGVVGLVLARKLYRLMFLIPGAVAGLAAAVALTETATTPVTNLVDPVVVAGMVVGAILAVALERLIVVFVSAGWGALLTWAAVDTATVVESLTTLAVPTPPSWVAILAGVGVLLQVALFGLRRRDGSLVALPRLGRRKTRLARN